MAACLAACPSYGASDAERIVAESHFCGGLIVQVGCRDAELAVSLAQAPNVLMQGLVADAGRLEEVRRQIRQAGLYGRVSATAWQGPWLPYADGMVNLLVVDSGVELDRAEIDRVLAPLGTAWTGGGEGRLTFLSQALARRRRPVVPLPATTPPATPSAATDGSVRLATCNGKPRPVGTTA